MPTNKSSRNIIRTITKAALTCCALLIVFFAFAEPVSAGQLDVGLEYPQQIGLGTSDIRVTIATIINVALGFLGTLAVLIVLYGGFLYMTSGGNVEQITKARRVLINGGIGLVIILAAFGIAQLIFNLFGIGLQPGFVFRAGRQDEYVGGTGALGGGIIQSIYPPRDAVDVPRGISVIITFKEEVRVDQIINCDDPNAGTDDDGDCNSGPLLAPLGAPDTAPGYVESATNVQKPGVFTFYHPSPDSPYDYTDNDINHNVLTDIEVMTPDGGKTFVFDPNDFMGNPVNPVLYGVGISGSLQKSEDVCDPAIPGNCSAFGNLASSGPFAFFWNFEVSTKLDITPPKVLSIIPMPVPRPGLTETPEEYRNIMIQINFNEPINPATIFGDRREVIDQATGDPEIDPANGEIKTEGFGIIEVREEGMSYPIAGSFTYGNNYQTVEFVTNIKCGENSCGEDVFCLPGNATIETLVKSASLKGDLDIPFLADIDSGFDGIIDLSGNALDGNENGQPDNNLLSQTLPALPYSANDPGYEANPEFVFQGESQTHVLTDDYQWSFLTNDEVNLTPPKITQYVPVAGQEEVDPRAPISAKFDELLSASTIKPNSNYGDGFCSCLDDNDVANPDFCNEGETCLQLKGYCVSTQSLERIACYTYIPNTCVLNRDGVELRIEDVCKQREFATLDQSIALVENNAAPNDATWYTTGSSNDLREPNNLFSVAHINHGRLLEFGTYGVRYGSGIRDVYQNCYTPSQAPGCIAIPEATPGSFREPATGDDFPAWPEGDVGIYPTCDLTGTELTTTGDFNLSYVTPDAQNQVLGINAFSWNRNPADIYYDQSLEADFDFYTPLLAEDTINFTLYYYNNTDDSDNMGYYLIAIASFAPQSTVLGQDLQNDDDSIGLESIDILSQDSQLVVEGTGSPLTLATVDLSEDLNPGDTTIQLESTSGLPDSGILLINGEEISYARINDSTTLSGITGVTQTHADGSSALFGQIIEGGVYLMRLSTQMSGLPAEGLLAGINVFVVEDGVAEFDYGPLPTPPAATNFIYPAQVAPLSDSIFTAELNWGGVFVQRNDGVIHKIGTDDSAMDFQIIPEEITDTDMRVRFIYPGGILDLQPDQPFSVVGQ